MAATIMKRNVASSRTLSQAPFKVGSALLADAQEGISSISEKVNAGHLHPSLSVLRSSQ
jgi:hypothetical protein